MKKILRRVDSGMGALVGDLQTLIRQPSVSAKNEGITQCANLVSKMLNSSFIPSQVLRLKKGIAPLVYGQVDSKSNPDRTLLFYNHYDVQPVEPLELWDDPPFGGTVRGNKVYGRGAADDKGELVTRIHAVSSFLKETGDVPCNIKFVIEGQEETGSPNIGEYLKKYQKKFACDGVIWEFGYVDSKDRPVISLGMKGLLFVELSVRELTHDAHSSLAALIKNPAWRLVEALGTLRDPDGRILVRDWYKEAVPLTAADTRLLSAEPFDSASFKKEFGIRGFVADKKGLEAKKALAGDATCNIAGLYSGYSGDGAKTVLPAQATAKIDFRLIPGMTPLVQERRLRRHLKSKGFGDILIKTYHGEAASRTDPSDPLVACVRDAADQVFGKSILNVSNAGTGPMHAFAKILGAPCVCFGSTYVFAKIHSPNEFARIDLLNKATKSICLIMDNFSRLP